MNFYDTNVLLDEGDKIFETGDKFFISIITLVELENIKQSSTKDEDVKYKARHVLHLLNDNQNQYEVVRFTPECKEIIDRFCLPNTADSQIIASARWMQEDAYTITFVTKDLSCKALARAVGLNTKFETGEDEDWYTGYKTVEMDDIESNEFYSDTLVNNKNKYNLLENEYLLIKYNGEITDKYKWNGMYYVKIPYYKIESKIFGKIQPKDIYQQLAMDSLHNNQITVMRGKAGSGKSYLGLSYLFSQLEKGKIDSIIIFCNTVAVRGAAKLGFYPGSRNEKLLDSQIGNFLTTKLGSITEVERMIDEGTLMLLPVADCRGVDLTGLNCGVFCTESQNTSADMMKLILQRIGEDCICVFEGDDQSQVDMKDYAGSNNGLRRLSEVFRGHDIYGEVNLPIIHRSKIAALAENI